MTRMFLVARWSRQLLNVLGIRLRTAGEPPLQGLLVANHISWVDVFAINALAPTTFLAKDEVRHWPMIGWLSARAGTLFLERGSRSAAQRARKRLIDLLSQKHRLGLFPEGTTSLGEHVSPFHGALFQSAIDAKASVAPVMLRYTEADGRPTTAAAYVGDTSLWQCVRSIATAEGLTAHVNFLPPIDSAGSDRRHLAHRCHQLISHALSRAVHPQPSGST
jgi:1-acyl-sn-glycerol-3-phosphate acyltransferase